MFNEFLYGKGRNDGDGKRGGKEGGGDDVIAQGLAKQMKKDRARQRSSLTQSHEPSLGFRV